MDKKRSRPLEHQQQQVIIVPESWRKAAREWKCDVALLCPQNLLELVQKQHHHHRQHSMLTLTVPETSATAATDRRSKKKEPSGGGGINYCPTCGSTDLKMIAQQTRSADEGMTYSWFCKGSFGQLWNAC